MGCLRSIPNVSYNYAHNVVIYKIYLRNYSSLREFLTYGINYIKSYRESILKIFEGYWTTVGYIKYQNLFKFVSVKTTRCLNWKGFLRKRLTLQTT